MTFLEAAIAILQREGRPLHYTKLTEIAVRDNLLSVVGRTPEATMQQRLNDALKKADPTLLLTREKPGIYGLRQYEKPPVRGDGAASEPPSVAVAPAEPIAAEVDKPATAPTAGAPEAPPAAAGERRRRGRRRRGEAEGAGEPERSSPARAAEASAAATSDEGAAASRTTPTTSSGPGPERRSFAEAAAVVAAAHRMRAEASGSASPTAPSPATSSAVPAPVAAPNAREPAPLVSAHAAPVPEVTHAPRASATPAEPEQAASPPTDAPEHDEEAFGHYGDDLDADAPTGPVIASALGTEDVVRGEDHRNVYVEQRPARGDRPDRSERRDRIEKERNERRERREAERTERRDARKEPAAPPSEPRATKAAEGASSGTTREPSGGEGSPIDAVVDVLRSHEGRPVPLRQLVEAAQKRKLLRGEPAELARLARAAIVADSRRREASGLRPRIRAVGNATYALDRRLESELYQLEREVADRAERLSEQTRTVLLRRMSRLGAEPFEALMRLLAGALGVSSIDLVKRGEGVAYFGGERKNGDGTKVRVLLSFRAGEQELGRRAIGELRAGLKARSYDRGILFAPGRTGAEALAELHSGGGVIELHHGEHLAALCARHGIGVIRRAIVTDVLDVELFAEVQEA